MSTRRALAFSFLDRYAALAIAIGSSMAIARLLTPTEIVLFAARAGAQAGSTMTLVFTGVRA